MMWNVMVLLTKLHARQVVTWFLEFGLRSDCHDL